MRRTNLFDETKRGDDANYFVPIFIPESLEELAKLNALLDRPWPDLREWLW